MYPSGKIFSYSREYEKRQQLFQSSGIIDNLNIYQAARQAMRKAIKRLDIKTEERRTGGWK